MLRDDLLLKVLALRPCANGRKFFSKFNTFSDAWKETPNPTWIGWYLKYAIPKTTPPTHEYLATVALINHLVELATHYKHSNYDRLNLAIVQTHMPFDTRLIWAQESMSESMRTIYFDHCMRRILAHYPIPPEL